MSKNYAFLRRITQLVARSRWRSLWSLDRLRVCRVSLPPSDVSPHSSMAKPNLLTVTLGPTGEAVFSSEVAKGFSRFRDARAGSTMGNVHTCGPNECVIISGESCWSSETAGDFPVEAVGGGWGGSQLTGSAKAYPGTHTPASCQMCT